MASGSPELGIIFQRTVTKQGGGQAHCFRDRGPRLALHPSPILLWKRPLFFFFFLPQTGEHSNQTKGKALADSLGLPWYLVGEGALLWETKGTIL